ncbi:twin-arginine translocase subunit TatC [Actinomadura madurae]|uniref:twin-arginine translocase subunit TatC n=1 Tax=Actinomadura madurae TaxID=1993 RepID=UPI002026B981|nr:twin-arginine translocase subunit TatC [Actinomadura madurae]MCP9947817.1 twin-arginine translocase subunit TatC [Actinomadura madurae]MCP9964584.1 twin-arginine translocase subunit TatC [Actinomadura madurae]MCP9977062.1 twin-arginine translocase subunit TatC [Actinomadura madurae]MCQ0011431.1 twin-arginine translocase subunit TatC [Actinomadura madurae]MCQ0013261.1 twin-arginine translocase subunit TatC [Actinomadura madurae]
MKLSRRDAAPDGRMPLMEHLRELRNRLIKAILGLVAGALVGWILFDPIWDFLKQPYTRIPPEHCLNGKCDLVVHGIFDGFFIHLKVALIVGAVLSSPVWLYQIWAFVAPGLYQKERRWTYTFLAAAVPLFVLGGGLAYLTMDKGLKIFIGLAPGDTTVLVGVQDYLGYAQAMLFIFGLTFELPLFVVMLNLVGVLTHERIRKSRRMLIFGVFVFAAVATPSQDPFTMLALALPTIVLFEVAELLAFFHDRRIARRPDPYESLSDDEASPLDLERIDAELERGDRAV